ncbi:hypothetical protein LPJ66_000517 [Kickxella alabastrina]|uniref:Uncharacterized protein n=1 Tax=Kickxella alabastrina TaxID=61397 RepID=A0ACC1IW64_9FUNG|nr:hypothetical protein LPJ66_000517 [Kickxella alabastrina]
MSDFANLPSVVVERIIRFAVDTDIDDISTWNYTLPLLAVCSNWRDSATRIVYGRAYLEGPNDRDSDDDSNSNLPKKTFDSNIDLIISTGNVPAVKHIGMYIRNLDSFKASIGRVDSIFGFNDHEWTGVTSIGVAIGIDEDDVEDVDPQVVSNLEKQVDHFAKRMAQRVPRVIHIRMYTDNLRTLSKRFGQKLTEAYSGQLSSLNCCYTNLVGISAFSNQLTSLVVRMKDEIGGILPWIPTAKIKTLKLIDLPVDFDWTQFQSTPEQTCIEFSNLRNLQLAYQREYSEDMSSDYVALVPGLAANGGIKVNFPMLDTTELDVSDINVAQNLLRRVICTVQTTLRSR